MTLLPSGRASPFAVLCFPSVALARKYQKVCRIKPKKFPIKHLSIPEWVKMLKRMKKRDVHFAAIVLRMENGQVLKAGVEIDQILATHDDPNSVLFGA